MIFCSPKFINWNLTNQCNFNCRHCYTRKRKIESELSTADCLNVVDTLAKSNVFEVNLGGGECLLRSDVFDVIQRLHSKGITSDLSTNGWLVDKECLDKLSESGLSKLYLSVDHVKPDIHDYIRNKPGSFNKAIECTSLLKEKGVPFAFSTVISKLNMNYIHKILELAKFSGAFEFSVKKFRPVGAGAINCQDFLLSEKENLEIMDKLTELANTEKDIRINFIYSDFPIPNLSEGCTCGKSSLAIHPNGDILMCQYGKTVLGNMLRDDLNDIWRNHPFLVKDRIEHKCEVALDGES